MEGTRSEVGVKRRNGKRVTRQTTARTTVGGRNGIPNPPARLDAECLEAWHELRGQCDAVLDDADASMLEMTAVALGRCRQARESITKHGAIIEVTRFRYGNETTELVDNPAMKQERDAFGMYIRGATELGIGPSARAKFSGLAIEGMQPSEAMGSVADLVSIRGGRA